MIKLLKYDLRRNANLLLGLTVVLIIGELVLLWSRANLEIKLVLTVFFFIAAAVIFAISSLKVFDYNIKSVSRRLLPVHAFSYVWASLLYGLINTLVLTLIGIGTAFYFFAKFDTSLIGDIFRIPVPVMAGIVLEYILVLVYGYFTIYVTIALARSITRKGVFWVGLIIFLIITNVTGWLENLLFNRDSSQIFSLVTFHAEVSNGVLSHDMANSSVNLNSIGTLIFEVLLCAVYLLVMKWCVEKRIEAK
ncbi:hypothetical protein [Paenibacillus dokdonensis]|uniref:hypothetical protein n=1 Tax=Paenibacillus dokdonensis TaxID=2567944 RepID=UPI0010A913F0|nr:hypothetical protein [Paenibacillus dokdonensis]